MLVALKQRVAPTDQARKIEPINQYQKLKKALRGQNLDTWIQQWEKTYKECKQFKLPDVEDDRPLYDFLNAISGIAPEFANVWTINIQMKLDSGDTLPDLYKIVELFWNSRRLSNAQKGLATHGAFPATFEGQSINKNNSEKKRLASVEKIIGTKTVHISSNRFARRIGNRTRICRRRSTKSYRRI
jgi:hypothetical protein